MVSGFAVDPDFIGHRLGGCERQKKDENNSQDNDGALAPAEAG
jgi:hypothetical protein